MSDTLNEPGVIGTMYENRKNKKVFVLESRDRKCKTLMLRDEDGNSISVQYSTFRSTYRKYSGDKVIYTSSQITGEKEEKEREKRMSKDVKDKVGGEKKGQGRKVKITAEDRGKISALIRESLEKYAGENTIVSSKSAGCQVLKRGVNTLVEFWPETSGSFYIACNLKLWDDYFRDKLDDTVLQKAKFMEKWTLQIKVSELPIEIIDGFAYTICEAFEKFVAENPPAEKKSKKAENSEAAG